MNNVSSNINNIKCLKYISSIIFLSVIIIINSCKSPLDIDAIRDKDTVFDPNNLPALIKVIPDSLDFGLVLPNDTTTCEFELENITKNEINISKILIKKNIYFKLYESILPFKLEKFSKSQKISIKFIADSSGYFFDTVIFNDYKKPYLYLKAKVPHVYARDLIFEDTKVGGISGKVLRIYNDGNDTAVVTGVEILENKNIFFNEQLNQPIEILPKSFSNIVINFNPAQSILYKSKIKLSVNSKGIVDDLIELKGSGKD